MYARLALISALALPGGACASLPSLPSLPDAGYRSIIVSEKPSSTVDACLREAWRKSFASVNSAGDGARDEIRVAEAGRLVFEAEVIPQAAGSTIVYTTPYGFSHPVGRSYTEAQACAAK